jgi:precorrin-4/cobalt-precorrin-4 C11-methyltransferase
MVLRASWPDETVARAPLAQLPAAVADWTLRRSALIFVGPALEPGLFRDSALYDPAHVRRYRGQ